MAMLMRQSLVFVSVNSDGKQFVALNPNPTPDLSADLIAGWLCPNDEKSKAGME